MSKLTKLSADKAEAASLGCSITADDGREPRRDSPESPVAVFALFNADKTRWFSVIPTTEELPNHILEQYPDASEDEFFDVLVESEDGERVVNGPFWSVVGAMESGMTSERDLCWSEEPLESLRNRGIPDWLLARIKCFN